MQQDQLTILHKEDNTELVSLIPLDNIGHYWLQLGEKISPNILLLPLCWWLSQLSWGWKATLLLHTRLSPVLTIVA